jgi:hypothetical protein
VPQKPNSLQQTFKGQVCDPTGAYLVKVSHELGTFPVDLHSLSALSRGIAVRCAVALATEGWRIATESRFAAACPVGARTSQRTGSSWDGRTVSLFQ